MLSPSTEAYDRGRKFEHYRSLDSVSAYLMVETERVHADLCTRQPGGQWLLTAAGPGQTLNLDSIGCRLSPADIYEKLALAESKKHANEKG
jgi:Uma2 family endonuclease